MKDGGRDGREIDIHSQTLASGCLGRAGGLGALSTMGLDGGEETVDQSPRILGIAGGAKVWRGSGSCQGRGARMCMVGERHLNIVGIKDKFKTHQM